MPMLMACLLPLGTRHAPSLMCNYTFASGQLQALPVTTEQIAIATHPRPDLEQATYVCKSGMALRGRGSAPTVFSA